MVSNGLEIDELLLGFTHYLLAKMSINEQVTL